MEYLNSYEKCPKCGNNLVYDSFEVYGDAGHYPVECPKCKWEGKECYELKYTHTEDYD